MSKTFSHGIHPPEHKEYSEGLAVQRLPYPDEVVVPLSQHIGAPAKPTVQKAQDVARGELIASPGGFVSVPMHAPLAGKIQKIETVQVANGTMQPAITIKVDPEGDKTIVSTGSIDVDTAQPADLVAGVLNAGIVGLGGAAFPTHVKMTVPKDKSADLVLANGCECEPYLTCDHRVMLEQANALFEGMRIALKATGAKKGIIGIEENKPDAIHDLRHAIPPGLPVTVEGVKTKYPQGAEKMLITALTGKEVPSGGLPIDVGAVVFNVGTLARIADLVPSGQGLIERVVTVTGPGVKNPGNYLVALGTSVRFVLDHVGLNDDAAEVLLGGPMMGVSVPSLDVPITKGVSGILVLTKDQVMARDHDEMACIKCGACVQACPMRLNPSRLGLMAKKRMFAEMQEKFHLLDCFECGSCAFSCPSSIPLVQYFRVAKALNRERKSAS